MCWRCRRRRSAGRLFRERFEDRQLGRNLGSGDDRDERACRVARALCRAHRVRRPSAVPRTRSAHIWRCRAWSPRRGARCRTRHSRRRRTAPPSFARASSLFFFSPLLKRQFSSITTCPGSHVRRRLDPVAHERHRRPEQFATSAARSARANPAGSHSPSVGRPRCDVTITAAPAFSACRDRRHRRADARVVGDVARVVLRHVEVRADEHPLAAQGPHRPCILTAFMP